MKKKALLIATIALIILIIGGAYLVDKNRMQNNKEVIFSTWGAKYTPSLETNKKKNNDKLVITHNKIENIDILDRFLDNTDTYNKNKVSDSITIVTYTIEGDEIISTLKYCKEEERYELTVDNLADKFAAEEDRKVETKFYSDSIFNLTKKIKDDYIYIMLEEDASSRTCGTEPVIEIIICSYKKDLEKGKDTNRIKIKEANLNISQDVESEQLIRYNGILYGRSYCLIDYLANPDGPIGTINKLVGEEYLPTINGETNSEELLNSVIDSANENSMILIHNNVGRLFKAIKDI